MSPVAPEALTRIGLPLAAVHRPDALANVALFMPLGLLLRVMFLRRGWSEAGSLLASVAIAGAAAYGIERAQLYLPSRVSSSADLACNLAGALIGAALASAALAMRAALIAVQSRVIRDWEEDVRKRPSGVAARLIAVGLFAAALAPFDVAFSVNRLADSIRSTNVRPFERDSRVSPAIAPPVHRNALLAADQQARDRAQLMLDYVWIVCGYALLGVFLRRYLVGHCRMTSQAALGWTIAAGVMLSLGCFVAQMLIMSRASDVTDVILAAAGALLGAGVSARVVSGWNNCADELSNRNARIVQAGLIACVAFACARELAPFTPRVSKEAIAHGLASIEWVPMVTYQRARLPIAMDDLLGKLGLFTAIGGLAAWRRWMTGNDFESRDTIRLIVVAVAGLAALECVQILLPSRMPSVTDLFIAAAGIPLGVGMFRHVMTTYQAILSRGQADVGQVIYNVEFDAAGPAPVEHVPMPKQIATDADD